MKYSLLLIICLLFSVMTNAQSPVGRWKKLSHISSFQGEKFDSHAALLQQRPCAAKVVYEVNADATFRLKAAASGCDERYIKVQEKLYSETKWRVEGNKITISATNFAVGQTYVFTISGKTMTWTGTEDQGTIVYELVNP
jgi:Lipocalin-like domain